MAILGNILDFQFHSFSRPANNLFRSRLRQLGSGGLPRAKRRLPGAVCPALGSGVHEGRASSKLLLRFRFRAEALCSSALGHSMLELEADIDTGVPGSEMDLDDSANTDAGVAVKRQKISKCCGPRKPSSSSSAQQLPQPPQPSLSLVPSGPSSYKDIYGFVDYLLEHLRAALERHNAGQRHAEVLSQLHCKTLLITTDYSGIGSAEWAVRFLKRSLWKIGIQLKVRFFSATDVDKVCRSILFSHREPAEHVFGNLLDRLPQGVMRGCRKIHKLLCAWATALWDYERVGGD